MFNRILVGIMAIATIIMATIAIRDGCQKRVETKTEVQIQKLRDTVYAYKTAHYTDTITLVKTRYRIRIDSIREWLNSNSSWESICREIAPEADTLGCRSILVQAYYKSLYLDTLVGIYHQQRTEDSLEIGYLMKLDSLNSEALRAAQKPSKVPDCQNRGDRLKQVGRIALGAIVGFIIGKI